MTKRPNGTGSVFYRKDKNRYCATVQVYDPYRRQLSRFFSRKKDAVNALPSMREELLHGCTKKEAVTLDSLYSEWSCSYMLKLSKSKQAEYSIAYKRLARISRYPIADLTIKNLQQLVEGLTYYQARPVKFLLSHLFNRAIAEQQVQVNLASYIELPPNEDKEAIPFSPDEVRTLWSAYNDGDLFAAQLLLMIYTGMMPGELIAATPDMIDWDNQRIIGAGLKTKERKTRNILIPNIILPVLRALVDSGRKTLAGLSTSKWYPAYHRFTQRIGIRDLPPYSCRHTTATALALGNSTNPLLITRAMRQRSPMMTERYKHADEAQVLEALNSVTYQ